MPAWQQNGFFRKKTLTKQATAVLRSGQKLIAPEIIRIEVAASFTRLFRMGDIDIVTVQDNLEKWQRALTKQAVSLEPTIEHFDAAAALSIDMQHQLQDCLYVAIASRLNIPLITTDTKLLKKRDKVTCEIQPLTA